MTDASAAGDAPDPRPLHTLEFRLAFGECDPAGIVYYATYLEWAERVHGEWWFLQGRPIGDPVVGPPFVVRHVSCDYQAAPRPNDLLRVSMSLERIGDTSFTLSFRFSMIATGATAGELWLTAVFVDDDMAPCAVPDDARALLRGSVTSSERGVRR